MPTLDIMNSTEDRFAFVMSGGHLLAAMLYPADAEKRERVTKLWGAFVNQYPGSGQPATDYQIATFQALSEHYTLSQKHWYAGIAAGRILRLVRQIATHRPEKEAGVLKAVRILTETHEILGKKMSRTPFMDAWRDFRSVSHLWVAAEQLLPTQKPKFDLQRQSEPNRTILQNLFDLQRIQEMHLTITSVPQFVVSIAEEWRQFGEEFLTSRQKAPLLDPDKTWAAPESYDLVDNVPLIPLLTQDETESLDFYRV